VNRRSGNPAAHDVKRVKRFFRSGAFDLILTGAAFAAHAFETRARIFARVLPSISVKKSAAVVQSGFVGGRNLE